MARGTLDPARTTLATSANSIPYGCLFWIRRPPSPYFVQFFHHQLVGNRQKIGEWWEQRKAPQGTARRENMITRIKEKKLYVQTNAPTVMPATTEGIEPVRMKPVRPPPAVRSARRKAVAEGLSYHRLHRRGGQSASLVMDFDLKRPRRRVRWGRRHTMTTY